MFNSHTIAGLAGAVGGAVIAAPILDNGLDKKTKLACYLAGSSLIVFSLYQKFIAHHHHRGHFRPPWPMRDHEGKRHHHHPLLRWPHRPDYSILGGVEQPYDYIFREKELELATEAGGQMLPRREPLGSYTGIGIEQAKMPMTSLYSYPDNVYEAGRKRVMFSS